MIASSTQIKNALAAQVKRRRVALGVSQEAFAARVGIDRTYASKIERGIGNPSLEVLCLLADALNCKISDLFADN
jgi:transcriptional regulator with XRE-family HTH domain